MRKVHLDQPLQVLLLAEVQRDEQVKKSVETGADDFIRVPYEPVELQARTRAAQLRWESQAHLVKEREFYRIAVAEEERLSSLVLDQNLNLKDAYEKIRRLNEELEKANTELEQIAAFDSLSGLLNRRSLFTRISIEIERSIRLDVPLTGLMIDIDKFKSINDNYGHQCGDMVIREIGARLQAGLRKYDYAGRYGGEEFFVVLSNSTEQQAFGHRRALPQGHGGAPLPVRRRKHRRHRLHRRRPLLSRGKPGILDRARGPGHVPGKAVGPQPHRDGLRLGPARSARISARESFLQPAGKSRRAGSPGTARGWPHPPGGSPCGCTQHRRRGRPFRRARARPGLPGREAR